MIFKGMWIGVTLGFTVLTLILVLFFTVFSKIMPGTNDEGEELRPEEM
jgi:hypothetical protein